MSLTALPRPGQGQPLSLRGDAETAALSVIDANNEQAHAGNAYAYSVNASAAATGSGVWYFATGSAAKVTLRIAEITAGGITTLTLYEYQGTTSSAGMSSSGYSASATGVNRDRYANSATAGDVTFYTGSGFVSTSATTLETYAIGAVTLPLNEDWPLKASTQYALHYVSGTADNRINVRLGWTQS